MSCKKILTFINPWKLGFFLIFFVNVVFHVSAVFLLFLILFTIFFYAYWEFAKFFKSFSDLYKADFVSKLKKHYSFLSSDIDVFDFTFNKLIRMRGSLLALVNLWRITLLNYICESILNRENYILIVFAVFYTNVLLVTGKVVSTSQTNEQRNYFLERSLLTF